MRVDLVMPQMGESIAEGTITRWMKKVGDAIDRDEPIFEISTDKVDAEIPAPAAGVLVKIIGQEGETLEVNTVVGVIETDGAAAKVEADDAPAPAKKAETPEKFGPRPPSALRDATSLFPALTTTRGSRPRKRIAVISLVKPVIVRC